MFDSIKKKFFPSSSKIIIGISCLLSIGERFLKIYATSKSIDLLVQGQSNTSINVILFWGMIMGFKYILGFFRHVTAYLGSNKIQEKLLDMWYTQQLQDLKTKRNDIENNEQLVLLQKICDNTREHYARISLDFIPGLISISFSSYIIKNLVKPPHSFYCIGFIIIMDLLYSYFFYSHEINDEENYEYNIKQTSRYYVIMGETIKYRNLVHNYNRYEYEKSRFNTMCLKLQNTFHDFNWNYNYHASLRLWIANIINAGAIFITINHINSSNL